MNSTKLIKTRKLNLTQMCQNGFELHINLSKLQNSQTSTKFIIVKFSAWVVIGFPSLNQNLVTVISYNYSTASKNSLSKGEIEGPK